MTMLILAACGGSEDSDPIDPGAELVIENDSTYAIYEIYLSDVGETSWGPDLLGGDVLAPGETAEISEIPCSDYDIRIVDEDDDECVLTAVELCAEQATWTITDAGLADCIGFGP